MSAFVEFTIMRKIASRLMEGIGDPSAFGFGPLRAFTGRGAVERC